MNAASKHSRMKNFLKRQALNPTHTSVARDAALEDLYIEGVRKGRRGGIAIATAAAIALTSAVEVVNLFQQNAKNNMNAQNLAAGKNVGSFLAGTLVLHKGVHTYLAPDTEGRKRIDPAAVADGNEIPAPDVSEDTQIVNPVEYIDPDGTLWLGYTYDQTLGWVKMAVVGQTDPEGKPYAEWKGGATPTSIPTAIGSDTRGFYDVQNLSGPNNMPASLGVAAAVQ